jgi:hypothetical protein
MYSVLVILPRLKLYSDWDKATKYIGGLLPPPLIHGLDVMGRMLIELLSISEGNIEKMDKYLEYRRYDWRNHYLFSLSECVSCAPLPHHPAQ